MTILQLLSRLCVSGADAPPESSSETTTPLKLDLQDYASKQDGMQAADTQATQDLTLVGFHRVLGELTGSAFQRIFGLLEGSRFAEFTGATSAALYAVPEDSNLLEEAHFILIAKTCLPDRTSPNFGFVATSASVFPDAQQAALFKKAMSTKAPVCELVDRSFMVNSGASFTAAHRHPNANPPTRTSFLAPNRPPRASTHIQTRIAAVPLYLGAHAAGVLWLEQGPSNGLPSPPILPAPSKSSVNSIPFSDLIIPPTILHKASALQTLGLAMSLCLLAAAPENTASLAWLATCRASLATADSVSVLASALCTAVVTHVRRRFVLDAFALAALVPPGVPEPTVALLLLPRAALPAGRDAVTDHPPASAIMQSVGGSSRALLSHVTSIGTSVANGGTTTAAALGGGVAAAQAEQLGGLGPSKRRLRPAGLTVGAPFLVRESFRRESSLRLSLDLAAMRIRATATGCMTVANSATTTSANPAAGLTATAYTGEPVPRVPSITMGPTRSSRSVVIPLSPRDPLTSGGTPGGSTAHNAAFPGPVNSTAAAAAQPSLHARAFPLQRTLLQVVLQQQQRGAVGEDCRTSPSSALFPGGAGNGEAGGPAPGGAPGAGGGAISPGVVEDMQLLLQAVHRPSADVGLIMGLLRRSAVGMLPAAVAGGGVPGVFAGSCSGMVAAGSVPQSLVLLTLGLADGGWLGLYLTFGRRLPGALLEAVRTSCQELLDKALGPLVRMKLREPAVAPEYDTLCCANPGSYAVVRSPSFSGAATAMVLPALSAAYMSNISDLGTNDGTPTVHPAAAGAATTPHPRDLLSDMLSTGDIDLLLGGPGHHVPPGSPGGSARRQNDRNDRSSLPNGPPTAASVARKSATAVLAAASSVIRRSHAPTVPPSGHPLPHTHSPANILGPGGEFLESVSLSQLMQSTQTDLLRGLGVAAGTATAAAAGCSLLSGAVLRSSSTRSLVGLGAEGGTAGGGGLLGHVFTVAGPEGGPACARQQLDLLMTSIHASINTDPAAAGGVNASPSDDLDTLELREVLGRGGGGTVFRGKMGTFAVAVKLIELPSVEAPSVVPAPPAANSTASLAATPATPPTGDAASYEKRCLAARREMLRNATELAVQSRLSHPNIVQIYATYPDVVLVPGRGQPGQPGATYRLACAGAAVAAAEGDSEGSPAPCVAAVFELCDGGSLGGALTARTFPRPAPRHRGSGGKSAATAGGVDWKGVYMTLLDVALALRHLHSMHLVHRDVKPANLLLKSNPRDHRGFTVKVADFGFVLHLNEAAEDGSRYTVADQACGTVTHMAPEALLSKAKIDASVDIYAFGILMWELFSGGVRPFPRLQPDAIPRAVYRGARPTFADDMPPAYRGLAAACWAADPQRRPKAADVVCLLNGLLQELEG